MLVADSSCGCPKICQKVYCCCMTSMFWEYFCLFFKCILSTIKWLMSMSRTCTPWLILSCSMWQLLLPSWHIAEDFVLKWSNYGLIFISKWCRIDIRQCLLPCTASNVSIRRGDGVETVGNSRSLIWSYTFWVESDGNITTLGGLNKLLFCLKDFMSFFLFKGILYRYCCSLQWCCAPHSCIDVWITGCAKVGSLLMDYIQTTRSNYALI